jgi:lipoate---protein ligase
MKTASDARETQIYLLSTFDPYLNLAIEEYLFDTMADDSRALLLYSNGSSVVLGKHQNPWREADISALREMELPLVRRISGGGTVYHDEGNLNFSFLSPKTGFDRRKNLQIVLEALELVGVKGSISDMYDLLVDGKKISGNSFCFRRNKALHHGTVLISARLEKMRKALNGAVDYIDTFAVASRPASTMNLKDILSDLTVAKVSEAIRMRFQDRGRNWRIVEIGAPSDYFDNIATTEIENLLTRNMSWEWIFGRTPPFTARPAIPDPHAPVFHVKSGKIVDIERSDKISCVAPLLSGVVFDSAQIRKCANVSGCPKREIDAMLALLDGAFF